MIYCNDVDLMRWEPTLFKDAAGVGQVLISGSGTLAGTTFTIASGSLTTSRVAAGCVVVADAPIGQVLPVVSVDSATAMTVSVLYGNLYPDDGGAAQPAPGMAGTANYSIRTFSGIAQAISEVLREAAGIVPGSSEESSVVILNPAALKRPCILGTISLICRAAAAEVPAFTQLASGTAGSVLMNSQAWMDRAGVYERLYLRALRTAVVDVDTDGDGEANERRALGVVKWIRE